MGKRRGRPNSKRIGLQRRLLVERLSERRVLATITGAVFEDLNHSFQRDSGEVNVPRRLVYVDANENASLDTGEKFAISEPDGTFAISDLADGTYLVRLFNATASQTQTSPVEGTVSPHTVATTGAQQLAIDGDTGVALTGDSVVLGNLQDGSSETVFVGNDLSKMQSLPGGRFLVVGADANGESAWVVDPVSRSVTATDLSDGQPTAWSELAIDGTGRGVVLNQSTTEATVRSIDASNAALGVQVTETSTTVPAGTQVLSSETGSRSVFAWSGDEGLQLSLWSNLNRSFISNEPFDVSGTTGLLAFDDDAGLLAVRTAGGGVSVHDVDANFAPLHTVTEATGPVAIDGARDLLFAISPADAMLKLINLRTGTLVADLAVDLSAVGQVASIVVDETSNSLVVLGAEGVTEIALRKPSAHEVTISGGQNVDDVLFGVALHGENTAPSYDTPPAALTNEDESIALPAPAALNGSSDAEGDSYVVLQMSQPANGSATIGVDGSFIYRPDDNFNGTDTVQLILHDGRDASAEIALNISVAPMPDPPTGLIINVPSIPENAQPGDVLGTVEIIDADGINDPSNELTINDPRLGFAGDQLIFIGGPINFEDEGFIFVTISATDVQTEQSTDVDVGLLVGDENDPITGIIPTDASVVENDEGALVAILTVLDEDLGQNHSLEVDDDRFVVVDGKNLTLAQGVAVDFEQEETISITVTATEEPQGNTFSQAIRIQVLDVDEQPESIQLSNETVMELLAGATVGEVTIDGRGPNDRYELSVDDSRFEIADGTLKLLDDVLVERASQGEIELTITVTDSQEFFQSISQTFVIEVLENVAPFHNQALPFDVDHDSDVSAFDALVIINLLNAFGPGPIGQGDPGFCYDVNADGFVTALDAMLVLNEINRLQVVGGTVSGETGGEGEQVPNVAPVVTPSTERTVDRHSDSLAVINLPLEDESEKDTDRADSSHDPYDPIDEPSMETGDRSMPDEFARNVDETMRLLSEEGE